MRNVKDTSVGKEHLFRRHQRTGHIVLESILHPGAFVSVAWMGDTCKAGFVELRVKGYTGACSSWERVSSFYRHHICVHHFTIHDSRKKPGLMSKSKTARRSMKLALLY